MIKKLILIILVIMMFTGCSKTISYKYNEAVSQSDDWSVENGLISIREGGDLLKFEIKYIGDTSIDEGEPWSCKVLVCEKNKKSSIDEVEVIFTRYDIYGKAMVDGDTKVVNTDNDVIDIENSYDFSSVYLKITYTKESKVYEDIIELSLKN